MCAHTLKPATYESSTPREKQILDLLLNGCGNADIAKELGMNPRTVKAYFKRLFIRFRIAGGIKRVKLAVLVWREMNRHV